MTKARQKTAAPELRAAQAFTGGNNGPKIKTDQPSPEATPKVFASRRVGKQKWDHALNSPMIAWFKDPAGKYSLRAQNADAGSVLESRKRAARRRTAFCRMKNSAQCGKHNKPKRRQT